MSAFDSRKGLGTFQDITKGLSEVSMKLVDTRNSIQKSESEQAKPNAVDISSQTQFRSANLSHAEPSISGIRAQLYPDKLNPSDRDLTVDQDVLAIVRRAKGNMGILFGHTETPASKKSAA